MNKFEQIFEKQISSSKLSKAIKNLPPNELQGIKDYVHDATDSLAYGYEEHSKEECIEILTHIVKNVVEDYFKD